MLPPFHIRNLQSPLDLVYVSMPGYEETLSSNLHNALKYDDDDGDVITIGSSFELEQHLGEKPSRNQCRQLAELHKSHKPPSTIDFLHVFSIDSDEKVQKTWDELQKCSRIESQRPQSDGFVSGARSSLHQPSLEKKPSSKCSTQNNIMQTLESCDPISAKLLDKKLSGHKELHTTVAENLRTATLENYGMRYFDTTNPPQLHLPEKHLNVMRDQATRAQNPAGARLLAHIEASNATKALGQSALRNKEHGMLAANLTNEGRRQAQIAGEKFRARELSGRPRKVSVGQTDRAVYHNRWASYKASDNSKSFLSGLTSESKRHAQPVGDRLRSRNNRIRHGVKGSPWNASTAEGDGGFGTKASSNTALDKAEETGKASSIHQKSLLEVFESELAKHPKDSACQTDLPFVPFGQTSTPANPICTEHSTPLASPAPHLVSQPIPTEIEDGIKNAMNGFEACLRGIVDTLKAAQPARSDKEILADTMKTFRGLTENVNSQYTVPSDANPYAKTPQAQSKAGPVSDSTENLNLQFPVMTAYVPTSAGIRKPHGTKMALNEPDVLPTFPLEGSSTQVKPDEPLVNKQKMDSVSDFAGPFHYHRPGPIHLPQQDSTKGVSPLTHSGSVARQRPGYVNHLRRFDLKDVPQDPPTSLWQQHSNPSEPMGQERSNSPTAVSTRFPTIGQFETATFLKNVAVPAPPSLIDFDPEVGPHLAPSVRISTVLGETEIPSQYFDRMDAMHIAKGAAPNPSALQKEQPITRSSGVSDSLATDKARLLRPFDAFAAEGNQKIQHHGNVRRSATIATPNLRRPYSEVFHSSNRVTWDPVTSRQSTQRSGGFLGATASSMSLPLPVPPTMPPKPLPLAKPLEISRIHRSATDAEARREANLRPRDIKIRKCIDSLTGLGFAMERSRLRVYASVAEGDLDEAIDMLTEDQKVNENRS